jgi:gliding motility-associated-like protein
MLMLALGISAGGVLRGQTSAHFYALEFAENRGQWGDAFQYRAEIGVGAFFLHPDGFTILRHDSADYVHALQQIHGHDHEYDRLAKDAAAGIHFSLRSHAYRVRFTGGNPSAEASAERPIQSNINYFLGSDPQRWKSGLSSFGSVTYRDVYPNIDVRYLSEVGNLKYDIIVRPGANLASIKLVYDGVDGLSVQKGQLVVRTSTGQTRELEPYAYQVVDGRKREVRCSYQVEGREVRFDVKNHDPSVPLIIDPTLTFGSYTGSRSSNWGYTATPGPDGSLFAGGIVFGTGYPITTGAIQATYRGGNVDIGITRFTPTGNNRIYSTYVGGDGDDIPHSLISDGAGNLVIMGRTTSSNYPRKGYGSPNLGGSDIVVTKLSANGTVLIGSAQIGGTNTDGANIDAAITPGNCNTLLYNYGDNARSEVILDDAGNIYVAANTQSADFPRVNAFQNTIGGKQDAVVVKLSPDLNTLMFSSFLGGSEDDGGFCIKLHPFTGDIYVAGPTLSKDLPGNKTGTIGTLPGDLIDGYVAVIAAAGGTLIRSTYLATTENDLVYGLQFDRAGFPYVSGVTQGAWPVLNAAYSNAGSKQFISKLKQDLSGYEFSTVYGSGSLVPNISPVAFLVDRCENLYVSGWGGKLNPCNPDPRCYDLRTAGPFGMPLTPDAIKPTTDNRDFYFIVLAKNSSKLLYGSYAGQSGGEGDHVDGGTSRFDTRGAIYQAVCANCGGNNMCPTSPITWPFPITPGVIAPVNGALGSNTSGECNLGAIKISFDFDGVEAGLQLSIGGVTNDTSGCFPLKVDFADTLAIGTRFIWDYGDGSKRDTTSDPSSSHTYLIPGSYNVMLIAIDSTKCIPSDTAFRMVNVRMDKALPDFNPVKLPPCENLSYRFDNLTVAPTGRPFAANSFIWDFGDGSPRIRTGPGPVTHTYPAIGTYNVKLILSDSTYCNGPDSITRTVRLSPNMKADFSMSEDTACAPLTISFTNTSAGGQSFEWDFGDGTTFTGSTPPPKTYTTGGVYTITLVASDPNTCNVTDTIRRRVYAVPSPTVAFTYTPFPSLENTPTRFLNGTTGATKYQWSFGDGATSTDVDPIHQYATTGINTVCLIATNDIGCVDTLCQPVQSIVVSALDVPNAFTPNGDGKNDRVYVRGFGIVKMNFRIYNRWGQLMFQSTDQNIGWDGYYKGRLQPMDAYGYVLDVEFNSGERATKKGDITLLR